MVRKGEIACHNQFLLLSPCFPQLYFFSASECGTVYPLLLKNGGIKKKIGVQNRTSMDTKLDLLKSH